MVQLIGKGIKTGQSNKGWKTIVFVTIILIVHTYIKTCNNDKYIPTQGLFRDPVKSWFDTLVRKGVLSEKVLLEGHYLRNTVLYF